MENNSTPARWADDASERRMNFILNDLRWLVEPVLKIKFNYKPKVYDIDVPCFIVSNHVTDWDPVLVGFSFRHGMHFVASEHIFRQGFLSRLLIAFCDPIARQKGGSAASTVRMMLRKIKEGRSVALFPEGNRSWDGRTRPFSPATGKLVRSSGVPLVTYRLHGGYFSSPRWSGGSIRRGRMTGEVVHVYPPEELKAMTADEINRHIAEDISEDAYAQQSIQPVLYKGKNRAEYLETLLFICPACRKAHVLKSSGNSFYCMNCGASAEYEENGTFSGNFGFKTITAWNDWQEERIAELCVHAGTEAIFSDSNVNVRKVKMAEGLDAPVFGTMMLYADSLVLPGTTIPLSEIIGMSVRGSSTLYIGTADGSSYQVKSTEIINVVKYLSACTALGCPVGLGI